jgi:hypothetical protein
MHILPNAYEQWEGRTEDSKRKSVLDNILRANKQNKDVGFNELISTFIAKIQEECHGFQRTDLVNLCSLAELQTWKEKMKQFDPIQDYDDNTQLQEEMKQLLAEIDTTRQSSDINTATSNRTNNKRKQQQKSKSRPKKRPKADFFLRRNNQATETPTIKVNAMEVEENQVWDPPE